jgi:hypothetical protein
MTYCFEFGNVLELFIDFDKQKDFAICTSFSNLLSRASSKMLDEWSLRFAQMSLQNMLSQFLESENLFEKKCSSLSTYTLYRKALGYMDATLCMFNQNDVENQVLHN